MGLFNMLSRKSLLRGPILNLIATASRFLQTKSETATEIWVKKFVCDLNLCPFARELVKKDTLLIKEITGENMQSVVDQIAEEAEQLCSHDDDQPDQQPEIDSALLVVPQFKDFSSYLDLIDDVQSVLDQTKISDHIQIATFHPKYQFQDTDEDDIENWTNKTPYPVVHLLKTDDVSDAIDSYNGNTEVIWKRNIKTVNKLGVERLTEMLKSCHIVIDGDERKEPIQHVKDNIKGIEN